MGPISWPVRCIQRSWVHDPATRLTRLTIRRFGLAQILPGIFLEAVERFDKPAQFLVKRDGAWRPIAAREARDTVEAVALGLRDIGVARGDRVALLCETR